MILRDENKKRFERLPKWAQRYIRKLENDIEYHKERVRQVSTGDSAIRWDEYGLEEPHGIPCRARVLFDVVGGTLEAAVRRGLLEVRVCETGFPMITPGGGMNVFTVFIEKYMPVCIDRED